MDNHEVFGAVLAALGATDASHDWMRCEDLDALHRLVKKARRIASQGQPGRVTARYLGALINVWHRHRYCEFEPAVLAAEAVAQRWHLDRNREYTDGEVGVICSRAVELRNAIMYAQDRTEVAR